MKRSRPDTIELALRRADRAIRIALRDESTREQQNYDRLLAARGPMVRGRAAG